MKIKCKHCDHIMEGTEYLKQDYYCTNTGCEMSRRRRNRNKAVVESQVATPKAKGWNVSKKAVTPEDQAVATSKHNITFLDVPEGIAISIIPKK